jgi:hypothetical protein
MRGPNRLWESRIVGLRFFLREQFASHTFREEEARMMNGL